VKKSFDVFFDTIPACGKQKNRRTDKQIHDECKYRTSIASRDKSSCACQQQVYYLNYTYTVNTNNAFRLLSVSTETRTISFLAQSLKEGLCFFAVVFKNIFFMISVRQIISTSTGPIFTKFALFVEL